MAAKGAAVFQGSFTQSGTNVSTWLQIPTGIDPGAGVLLEMISIEVFIRNSLLAFTGGVDSELQIGCSRSAVIPSLSNPDVFGMMSEVLTIGAGETTSFFIKSAIMEASLIGGITLQPFIYVSLVSTGLNVPVIVDYRINYNTTKTSGAEYLRLLAGGV